MPDTNTAGGAGTSVAEQLPPCPHCNAVWHRRDCPVLALPPTENIIRWEERLLPPRTELRCSMNCSPRHGDCSDCAPVQVHDDAVAARDSEILELRAAVAHLKGARSIEPDFAFRARVADLFHLTQFYPFVSKGDEAQAMKAAQDIKAMLASPPALSMPVSFCNVSAVERSSDQSVRLTFASCHAASAFEREAKFRAGQAAPKRGHLTDREIMLEWDQHRQQGEKEDTPFLRVIVHFARSMMARSALSTAGLTFDTWWTAKAIEYEGTPFSSRRDAAQDAWRAALQQGGV